jgi:hypothetical protein
VFIICRFPFFDWFVAEVRVQAKLPDTGANLRLKSIGIKSR